MKHYIIGTPQGNHNINNNNANANAAVTSGPTTTNLAEFGLTDDDFDYQNYEREPSLDVELSESSELTVGDSYLTAANGNTLI